MKHLKPAVCVLSLLIMPLAAQAEIIAFDMVGSASQNLVSHNNPWDGAFASAGDGFQKYQRGVSGSIPFAVLDDSAVTFPADGIGIIDDFNTDEFFGIVDTENNDNSGPVSASWIFDISGFSNLSMSIDAGAMGDFEASDFFAWSYSIDGGPLTTIFEGIVDETGSLDYTLAGGGVFTLADPMTVGGTVLSNILQTLSASLIGAGNLLELSLTAMANGGNEGVAFQNLIIEGDRIAAPEPATALLLALGLGGLGYLRRRRTA